MSKTLYKTLLIALAYAVTAQVGHQFALLSYWDVTLFWPPSGIALAAALLLGRQALPGIFLGALVVALLQSPSLEPLATLAAALGIATASTLSALAAAAWLKTIAPQAPRSVSPRELIYGYTVMGLACIIAASGGVGSLYLAGLLPADTVPVTWSMWWLGDFCGMWIFGPITWVAIKRLTTPAGKERRRPAVAALFLNSSVAVAALLLFILLWNLETDRITAGLERESVVAANNIAQTLQTAGRDIEAIKALLYSSERIDAEAFQRYTTAYFNHHNSSPVTQGIGWAPRVTNVRAWEKARHEEGRSDVRLYELDASRERQPVGLRYEYFPVTFIQPYEGSNQRAIGFDLASEPMRRAALERARDSNQLSMVSPIYLVQSAATAPAILLCAPVYRSNVAPGSRPARRDNLSGFASGVYYISALFEQSLIGVDPGTDLHLFDNAHPSQAQWLHGRATQSPANATETPTPPPKFTALTEGPHGTAQIHFADHTWQVVASASPAQTKAQRTWTPWLAMTLVLALGMVMSGVLLERIAARRRMDAERRRTEQALREAQAANDSKSYFMAAAGHDIKQPLFALSMLTDTLLMTNPPKATVHIIESLGHSIDQMSKHFDTLMDVGRFHGGNFEVNPTRFRLGEFAERIDLEIAPLCASKGLKWTLDMDNVWVFTDAELLLRLFRNLLTNAVQYTDEGEITCRATAFGDAVNFVITDTGIGIAPELQSSIFQEFVRLEETGAGTTGVGLGLSIVEKINLALDLKLSMSSTPGKGTHFSFRLPQAPVFWPPISTATLPQ